MSTPFVELSITGKESAWCVDGRRSFQGKPGPKMLGGSLHIVLLWCLWEHRPFDDHSIHLVFRILKRHGFGLGVHRGSHKNVRSHLSDCGFADNLPAILEIAASRQNNINQAVTDLFHIHGSPLHVVGSLHEDMKKVWQKLSDYPRGTLTLWGEDCVKAAHKAGAIVHEVTGNHHEEEAFINLDTQTTLDTDEENREGHQAFDLDLGVILDQGKVLHLPKDFVLLASLVLYVATEIVLVERKGKTAIPLTGHIPNTTG